MRQKGQTLIELLITIGLSAILIPALLTGFALARNGRAQQDQRLKAVAYVKEAEEGVRVVTHNAWENITNGVYHPAVSGSTWSLVSGSESIDGFTRRISI